MNTVYVVYSIPVQRRLFLVRNTLLSGQFYFDIKTIKPILQSSP
jgi:hypothetical protein